MIPNLCLNMRCNFKAPVFKVNFLDRRTSVDFLQRHLTDFSHQSSACKVSIEQTANTFEEERKDDENFLCSKICKKLHPHVLLIKSILLGDTQRNYRALHNESVGPSKEALSIRFCVAVWNPFISENCWGSDGSESCPYLVQSN